MSNMTTMTSVAEQYNQDDSCSDDEELKPGESQYLFAYNGNFIAYWEIFIILVAILNAFTIPF